jgi:quercetin dioxygenase-like cupin family protein
MPRLIPAPTVIPVPRDKLIEEYFGRVNTGDEGLSIARMKAPAGWSEPGQRPTFRELTVVLEGCLVVETEGETLEVRGGQAITCEPGEWVRYSTGAEGAHYLAICLPAFSLDGAGRDPE